MRIIGKVEGRKGTSCSLFLCSKLLVCWTPDADNVFSLANINESKMPKSKEMISDSESASSISSEEEAKIKSKPKKQEKKKEKSSESDNSESEQESKSKKRAKKSQDKAPNKKVKKSTKSKDDEDPSWDIGGNKHVTVRFFRGKLFIDIREMYMDKQDLELKPGKKGICLNTDNWRSLVKIVDEVDKCVKSKC